MTVLRDGDRLFAQPPQQPRIELFPTSDKDFFARIGRIEFTFVSDASGAVTGMTLHQGGRDTLAKRISAPTLASVQAKAAAIDAMIAEEFSKHPTGSVTAGVVFGDQLVWTKSYGQSDMEKKLAAVQPGRPNAPIALAVTDIGPTAPPPVSSPDEKQDRHGLATTGSKALSPANSKAA